MTSKVQLSHIALPQDNIPYVYWFNTLRQDLPTFEIPQAQDEKNWVEDAEFLMRNPQCVSLNCPWPQSFKNWRDWAQAWVLALGGQI